MRRIALIALVAGVAAAVMATPAFAINSVLKFEVKFSPTKVGTKKKPQAITLFTRPYYDTLAPDADAPFAWKQARIWFPKEGVFNGKYFPSCAATQADDRRRAARPARRPRSARSTRRASRSGSSSRSRCKLYNLPGGKGIALYLQGDNPVIIDHVVTGILTRLSSDPLFGYKLTFDVPPDLIQPAPGAYATALDFKVTVPARTITKGKGKKKKKYPYIGTTGCPASGIFTAKFETDNTDGTTSSVTTTAPCKK